MLRRHEGGGLEFLRTAETPGTLAVQLQRPAQRQQRGADCSAFAREAQFVVAEGRDLCIGRSGVAPVQRGIAPEITVIDGPAGDLQPPGLHRTANRRADTGRFDIGKCGF